MTSLLTYLVLASIVKRGNDVIEQQQTDLRGKVEELTALLKQNAHLRERAVLERVAVGLSNFEIGQQLGLSEKTIKHYMTNILGKLQVRSRVEAAVLATKAGLGAGDVGGR